MNYMSRCTKCGSKDLLFIPTLTGEEPRIAVGEYGMHMVSITRLVCGRCGYIEQWISNPEDIKKLKHEYSQPVAESSPES